MRSRLKNRRHKTKKSPRKKAKHGKLKRMRSNKILKALLRKQMYDISGRIIFER